MAKNERKTRTKRTIFVVVALLLVAYLISSTYARYSAEGKANGKVDIAKWAVAMKVGDTTLTSTPQDITFTVQSNEDVVPGKIAPAVTAKAEIELDLTGTEVSVDVTPTIGSYTPSDLPSADKITLTSEVEGVTSTNGTAYIPLVENKAFTSENGKKKIILTLTWTNDDENNADDTATGMLADGSRTITVPVTLTVQQHIKTTTTPTT